MSKKRIRDLLQDSVSEMFKNIEENVKKQKRVLLDKLSPKFENQVNQVNTKLSLKSVFWLKSKISDIHIQMLIPE